MIFLTKRSPLPLLLAMVIITTATHAFGDLFTPGDLIVESYGSAGSTIAQGAQTPIKLIEFSTSGGAPILTDTLATADGVAGAANHGIVGQYGSSSEGNIQLSGDGHYLTLAGYSATASGNGIQQSTNTANGTSFANGTVFSKATVSLAQSTDTNVPRLAALVDSNGIMNSSTEMNTLYNTNNPRAVYAPNNQTFYISGQGDGNTNNQGIYYGAVGLNTVTIPAVPPTPIYNANMTRYVTAYNNNLYVSIDTSAGTPTGIWQFTGTPTTASSPSHIIPANNGLTGSNKVSYSPEGFFFANSTTLYVADTGDPKAGSLGDGGIQKWTFNGSSWILQYTLAPSTNPGWVAPANTSSASSGESGFEAITGKVVGSGPTATVNLYAVSYTIGDDNPDGLYAITDTLSSTTGAGETFTELESAAGNGAPVFKGVSFAPTAVPEPATLSLLGLSTLALLSRRIRASIR